MFKTELYLEEFAAVFLPSMLRDVYLATDWLKSCSWPWVFGYNLGHNIEANRAKLYFHQLTLCPVLVNSFLDVIYIFPEPQFCPAVWFYYSKANSKAQILLPNRHKARKAAARWAGHAEEHRIPCMSQKTVAWDVQEYKMHFKSGQKSRKTMVLVDLWIKHLSVSKPLLSLTWHHWLYPQEKLCSSPSPTWGKNCHATALQWSWSHNPFVRFSSWSKTAALKIQRRKPSWH